MNNADIGNAMVIKLDPVLPEYPTFKEGVRRAPMRELTLNKREIKLAVANALRYVPEELHEQLAPEFLDELLTHGRIYGYRFMPKERIYGKPIDEYKGYIWRNRTGLPELDAVSVNQKISGKTDTSSHTGYDERTSNGTL